MDLNLEYAEHQRALMQVGSAANDDDRQARLHKATMIAKRISRFQHGLGAAAACAWSTVQLTKSSPGDKGGTP